MLSGFGATRKLISSAAKTFIPVLKAAELVIHSYIESFFKEIDLIRVGIGRAGNVIGGEIGLGIES